MRRLPSEVWNDVIHFLICEKIGTNADLIVATGALHTLSPECCLAFDVIDLNFA